MYKKKESHLVNSISQNGCFLWFSNSLNVNWRWRSIEFAISRKEKISKGFSLIVTNNGLTSKKWGKSVHFMLLEEKTKQTVLDPIVIPNKVTSLKILYYWNIINNELI